MKYIFLVTAVVLMLAGLGTYLSFPDTSSEVPVIYWVTDPNPARVQQVEGFTQWLIKNGHVDDQGRPVVRLVVDAANGDNTKKIIQSVSGVAGDTMDLGGGRNMRLFQDMGVIADITEPAQRLGFGPDNTYAAIEPEITFDGKQYTYPCNVSAPQFWVNKQTFDQHHQPHPPDSWTFEEFESRGKAFVAAANVGRRPGDRVFFADQMTWQDMNRSQGLSMFNETMTASDLDDPRFVKSLTLSYKWIYEDSILPSPEDKSAFDAAAGYGGLGPQLFNRGNFAMLKSGRYMLIQFRKFGALELDVTEFPNGGFPTSIISTRAASVYAGGKHQDLTHLFLAYLASEDYNLQIVNDADALPPNPAFTQLKEFTHPADFPNEHGVADGLSVHEKFLKGAQTIAISAVYSPYVLLDTAERETVWFVDELMQGKIDAETAARDAAAAVNQRIADNVRRDATLSKQYEADIALQKKIDERLDAGQKVPRSWIKNIFYLRYYESQDMLEDDSTSNSPKTETEGANV